MEGNDVEGVLAIKKPWPSMARTVWGAHQRYMDTYLNVYKGYYVGIPIRGCRMILTPFSSLETVLVGTTKATTGSVVESMMWSTFQGIVCLPPRSKQLSSNTVSTFSTVAKHY